MPDDADRTDRSWLLEPLGSNDVIIHVDVGEGVEISEEARAALDTLVQELHSSEVEGFAIFPTCPSLSRCGYYSCTLGKCNPLMRNPCLADQKCWIAGIA
jgi:hypothetical protein